MRCVALGAGQGATEMCASWCSLTCSLTCMNPTHQLISIHPANGQSCKLAVWFDAVLRQRCTEEEFSGEGKGCRVQSLQNWGGADAPLQWSFWGGKFGLWLIRICAIVALGLEESKEICMWVAQCSELSGVSGHFFQEVGMRSQVNSPSLKMKQ